MRSSTMKPLPLLLLLAALLFLWLPGGVEAETTGHSRLRIGFANGRAAGGSARWSRPDVWQGLSDGLGWRGRGQPTSPLVIRTTRPLALGFSDRPAHAARVDARLTWKTPRACGSQSSVFVRHSPDAHHWSTWQLMSRRTPTCAGRVERLHLGLAIPQSTRRAYAHLLRAYEDLLRLPHGDFDEGAAVWYLQTEAPGFLERERPFLGYLQFLIEARPTACERLCTIELDATWSTSDAPRAADAIGAGSWDWRLYRLGTAPPPC